MQRRLLALSIALAGITLAACGDDDVTAPVSKIVRFTATLNGASEVPANTSAGTGTFVATLDTSTNVFIWTVTVTGLTSNINNGHIHGPAAVGVNASTTINFNPAVNNIPGSTFVGFGTPAGTATGTVTLTAATAVTPLMNGDSLKKLLFAGLTYANIHSTQLPGGELRGQILKQ